MASDIRVGRSGGRDGTPQCGRQDPSDIRFRLHCFFLWESAYVDFVDMGFEDCWVAAVASYASLTSRSEIL